MKEIWKKIPGFEDHEISNLGRIRILRYVNCPLVKGYPRIYLTKNHKTKRFLVHRLVAQLFIPNPNNYRIVNHKDYNRENNCVNNLEWTTDKGNYEWSKHRNHKAQMKVMKTKTGHHYIYWVRERYCFQMKNENRKFRKLEDAIAYRNKWIKEHYPEKIAYLD